MLSSVLSKRVAWVGPLLRSRSMILPSLLVTSPGMGADRASSARNLLTLHNPLARRDVPLARARAFQASLPILKGVAKAALYCAHRTSTFLSCAFCEQEGTWPLPPHPSEAARCASTEARQPSSSPTIYSVDRTPSPPDRSDPMRADDR
jgi:hypothetical protein